MTEILIAKRKHGKMNIKVVDKRTNSWTPDRYKKILTNKDPNNLALLLYDLHSMGYPIEKAYKRFKELFEDPELFFL